MSTSNLKIGNTEQALRRTRAADLAARQEATTILGPGAIASGKLSPAKLLTTTAGGVVHAITAEDLRRFKARADEVGSAMRAGITPQEVIALSRPEDVRRARAEIAHAVPALMRGSLLRMATSSSPKSRVTRHIVEIEFPRFGAAVARPVTAQQAAAWLLADSPMKFDCDCGRHRYWYRYIASIGGFSVGRAETGFPKIRNPELHGVACKHVIRSLAVLPSLLVRRHVAKAIEEARRALDRPGAPRSFTVRASQSDANRATARKTARRIVVSQDAQRRAVLAQKPSAADIQAAMAAFRGKTDANSIAVLRALQALSAHGARQ